MKMADTVISMLDWGLKTVRKNPEAKGTKHVRLHADNCAMQNKNLFGPFYLIVLILSVLYESAELFFMIPGHTKNVCDSSFWHVKRLYRSRNVLHPQQMMGISMKVPVVRNASPVKM